ncbi:GIY-YIG nuclease family protein [Erythrobacter sp. GH1-10]|uniref:GIY-YIG nuclease family protein n=1 Tax=Erythrobacter sp. GH1-10 TaxID=3349334 RepID=UPI003877A669
MPASIDIRMYSRERDDFPAHTTFLNHFGNRTGLLAALKDWAQKRPEYADVLDMIPEPKPSQGPRSSGSSKEGFVYLLKSGDFYKIGRSDEIERRVKQISIAMPENVDLEHTIRTDDPPGIENYWHRRFAERRAKGEWFRLDAADVKAFKRRRFQ